MAMETVMPLERVCKVAEVFGINRDLPVNYIERSGIDEKLIENLTRDQHIVIFGSSKQGKRVFGNTVSMMMIMLLYHVKITWICGNSMPLF
jgi:hypothetical protein